MNPPPSTAPSPRLLELRATLSLCFETEANWHQHHAWTIAGRCKRCNANAFESAPVPPLVTHNEEPDR